jgi:transposase
MALLEIKEVLRHWLHGRAKKQIARRLGVDVKTVRKYVRAAEEYGLTHGLTRRVGATLTSHVVFGVAAKVYNQELGRPRGESWEWCSRHRAEIRRLLEGRSTLSEIRSALGLYGASVSASTLYRFIASEAPSQSLTRSTTVTTSGAADPWEAIARLGQGRMIVPTTGRHIDVEERRMLRLLKRHEIQVLLGAHHTQEEVAELAGVSVSPVRRVAKEGPVEPGNDAAEHGKRRIGRPSVVKNVRTLVEDTLKARPDLNAVEILRRARLAGYRGGGSAFYDLVASLRSKSRETSSSIQRPEAPRGKDPTHRNRLESQHPSAGSSCQCDHETRANGKSERVRSAAKSRQTAKCYSLRLEYAGHAPVPTRAVADRDLLPDWYRDFAISGQHTLEQLSSVILRILDWDPDHLYEFRIGGRLYASLGEDSLFVDMREPGVSCDIPVKLVGLAQGDTFTYLFDFGDGHTFRLTVLAIEPLATGQPLPVMLSHGGNDLVQYSRSQQEEILRSVQSKLPSVGPPVARGQQGRVRFVRGADREMLAQWRKSNDKRLWQKAVAILENWTLPLEEIAQKIEKSPTQIRSWVKAYNRQGLEGLLRRKRRTGGTRATKLELRRRRILEILHGRPAAYGINRSNWNLRSLVMAYMREHGDPLSTSTASRIVRDSGYVMKKMRRVLSSPDPRYREKVDLLLQTLHNLGPRDLFFFIDELGPLRVKKYGGRAYVPRHETETFPQAESHRGSVTLAGALSATTNQVTWIYGTSKDSSAMIDLIEILFNQHPAAANIYLTWDAASWHSSSRLVEWLDSFNAETERKGGGPVIHLVPLPVSSQFLDVIEAVFSGMKRAIIHHSDYKSVQEMKEAISLHFVERNAYFRGNPRRAGKKIWEIDFFTEQENIRSGNYRPW